MHERPPMTGTLAHYGKKGMKWGVRKGYVERQRATGEALVRAGTGQGTKAQRIGTRYATSRLAYSNKALEKAGHKKIDHAQRLQSGHATIRDKLQFYGTTNMLDIRKQPVNYGKNRSQIAKAAAKTRAAAQAPSRAQTVKSNLNRSLQTVNKGINAYADYRQEVHTNAQLGGLVGALRGDPYAVQRRNNLVAGEKFVTDVGKKAVKKVNTEVKVAKLRHEMRNM